MTGGQDEIGEQIAQQNHRTRPIAQLESDAREHLKKQLARIETNLYVLGEREAAGHVVDAIQAIGNPAIPAVTIIKQSTPKT